MSYSSKFSGPMLHQGTAFATRASPVQPSPRPAEQPLWQEDDDADEDDAERYEIGELVAEQPAEKFAEQEECGRAKNRADQRADATHDVVDHCLAGDQEE